MKTFECFTELSNYVNSDERQRLDTEFVALWQETVTGDIKSCHIEYWFANRSFQAIHAHRSVYEVKGVDLIGCFMFVVLDD